jgi:regulatory protein
MSPARHQDSPEECRFRAVRLLTVRARSREELRRSLELRGFAAGTIGETLDALVRDGSLNEQAALETFLMNREERFSRERLRTELRLRGFAKERVDGALSARSDEDERALLDELFRRRSRELASLPAERRKKKVFDFLRRRGFPVSAIFEVIGEPEE